MNQLLAVALLCSAAIAPDNCTRDTALDVRVMPVPSPLACMMTGQVSAAHDGTVVEDTYLKIQCLPRGRQREAAAQ